MSGECKYYITVRVGGSFLRIGVIWSLTYESSGTCVCPRTPEDYACNNDTEYEMCVEGGI